MSEFIRIITLQDPATRTVMAGACLLGLCAGLVGCFTLLRKRALVGDVLAHAALPGICVAYLVLGGRSFVALLIGALCSGVLAVATLAVLRSKSKVREDAALGGVLSGFFALGIVLSSIVQRKPVDSPAGLDTFIYGQAAVMTRSDVITLAVVASIAIVMVAIFGRRFMMLCFDEAFAKSAGMRTLAVDFALMVLVCLVTIAGLPAAGVVLIAALLIIPAVTARMWTQSLNVMLVIASLAGALCAMSGVAISGVFKDVPTGPAITLFAGACFVVSLLISPRVGIVRRAMQSFRTRRRIAMQNLLRASYELRESGQSSLTVAALALKRAWSVAELERLIDRACGAGLMTRHGAIIELTKIGESEAAQVVRAHRLWELYLIEEASLPSDHVDRDADLVEHMLSAETLDKLEERLRLSGRLPSSPHPVAQHSDAGVHA